jgi:serine/threonine protein kinase
MVCLLLSISVSSSDSKGKGQTYIVKIGDFGLARVLETEDLGHSLVSAIPLKWSALEVLQTGEYSTKSDVWSFGRLIFFFFFLFSHHLLIDACRNCIMGAVLVSLLSLLRSSFVDSISIVFLFFFFFSQNGRSAISWHE